MQEHMKRVLFVGKGNSARSIIAEALLNEMGKGRFVAHSAGSQPDPEVHPLALETLRGLRIPVDGLRSKSWVEFCQPDSSPLDLVFTLSDSVAAHPRPAWPGNPLTAHWGEPDPASVQGSSLVMAKAFGDAAIVLKRRIELMLSLPLDRLDRRAVQGQLRQIGTQ